MPKHWLVSLEKQIRIIFSSLKSFSANFFIHVHQGTLIMSLAIISLLTKQAITLLMLLVYGESQQTHLEGYAI